VVLTGAKVFRGSKFLKAQVGEVLRMGCLVNFGRLLPQLARLCSVAIQSSVWPRRTAVRGSNPYKLSTGTIPIVVDLYFRYRPCHTRQHLRGLVNLSFHVFPFLLLGPSGLITSWPSRHPCDGYPGSAFYPVDSPHFTMISCRPATSSAQPARLSVLFSPFGTGWPQWAKALKSVG
jgi:hypothetical protein